jgi:hypothetical protein
MPTARDLARHPWPARAGALSLAGLGLARMEYGRLVTIVATLP